MDSTFIYLHLPPKKQSFIVGKYTIVKWMVRDFFYHSNKKTQIFIFVYCQAARAAWEPLQPPQDDYAEFSGAGPSPRLEYCRHMRISRKKKVGKIKPEINMEWNQNKAISLL